MFINPRIMYTMALKEDIPVASNTRGGNESRRTEIRLEIDKREKERGREKVRGGGGNRSSGRGGGGGRGGESI